MNVDLVTNDELRDHLFFTVTNTELSRREFLQWKRGHQVRVSFTGPRNRRRARLAPHPVHNVIVQNTGELWTATACRCNIPPAWSQIPNVDRFFRPADSTWHLPPTDDESESGAKWLCAITNISG